MSIAKIMTDIVMALVVSARGREVPALTRAGSRKGLAIVSFVILAAFLGVMAWLLHDAA